MKVNLNRRLLKQLYLKEDEVEINRKKTESIKQRVGVLSVRLTKFGWEYHKEVLSQIIRFIGIHRNPTSDNERNRLWMNLPSQELVDYLNRLWELTEQNNRHSESAIKESLIIIDKLQDPQF